MAALTVLNLDPENYLYLENDCDGGGGNVVEALRLIFFAADVRLRKKIRRPSRIHHRNGLFGEDVVLRVVEGIVGFEEGSSCEAGLAVCVDMVVLEDCTVAVVDDDSVCSLQD